MNTQMTPEQALQLISEALEPRNLNAISRQGFCSLQQAIEVLAAALKANSESSVEHSAQTRTHPSDGGTALL